MKNYLEAGKIVGVHGVKGEVKVQPFTDTPYELKEIKKFSFDEFGNNTVKAISSKLVKNIVVFQLQGIDTVEKGQGLIGKKLFTNRDNFQLEEGVFFIADLIGLKVIDFETNEEYGTLIDVTQTGANDVYYVKTKDGKILLVPAIKEVIKKTDIANKVMEIKPLEGLFD